MHVHVHVHVRVHARVHAQVRACFSRAFAPVLTAAMASFQSIAPLEWQAIDNEGRRMHYLDLNFGELDFDVAKGLVTARVFGVGKEPVLERAFSLRDLGVGGACRPVHGFLPEWRHAVMRLSTTRAFAHAKQQLSRPHAPRKTYRKRLRSWRQTSLQDQAQSLGIRSLALGLDFILLSMVSNQQSR